ncbi:lipoyl protein ligase domain-containing protein [Polyangium sorediatum]|uniref:BPL/LPL catalytic domain-containing protein n=1 Tax=Polyangium sorediatum TaxID=889274 RepID=A0ABT6NXS2_9BACT|nr:hypothetical protein [Polyangium sorediatum]MDI1433147.1 hypothetical protein [Polyangium sorediatum]
MHAIELRKRPIPEALALGPALVERAEQAQAAHLALSLVDGAAVVLGAAQRAGRVVDLAACRQRGIPILRRATTGTAAWLGGRGLVVTLALPHVAALVADATPRTLLNRNVRPLLGALTRAGMLAHYFGREWITLRRRPAALLGFDVAASGAVLVEAFIGHDAAIALPDEITTESERAVDRFLGKKPASLAELATDTPLDLDRFAHALLDALRARTEPTITTPAIGADELDTRPFAPIEHARDPIPERLLLKPAVRVPIGWIESAVEPEGARRVWLGGDVLAPRWALARIATQGDAGLPEIALEGATMADLLAC